jgi:hypothetical protein
MLSPQQTKALKNDPNWKALREHLEQCIAEMDSCSSIPDNDDHDKASRGRKEAVRILQQILKPFMHEEHETIDRKKHLTKKYTLDN